MTQYKLSEADQNCLNSLEGKRPYEAMQLLHDYAVSTKSQPIPCLDDAFVEAASDILGAASTAPFNGVKSRDSFALHVRNLCETFDLQVNIPGQGRWDVEYIGNGAMVYIKSLEAENSFILDGDTHAEMPLSCAEASIERCVF